jgi:hypothetical protein
LTVSLVWTGARAGAGEPPRSCVIAGTAADAMLACFTKSRRVINMM